MPKGLDFRTTRQAKGNFRLDLWLYTEKRWMPFAHYQEIDWEALDRKARDRSEQEIRLVNVKTGEVLGEWADGKRMERLKGAMA